MTIWFGSCLRISGSVMPVPLMRCCMIETAVSRSDEVTLWPGMFCAWRTTSRPPRRSRPSVAFLCAGEPGTSSISAPTRAAMISDSRKRYLRRSRTAAGSGYLPRGDVFRLRGGLVDRRHGGHRAAVEPDLDARRDLDQDLLVGDRADGAVEPTCGDDLVAGLQQLDQPQQVLDVPSLAAPLGHHPYEPEQHEQGDEDEEGDYRHGGSLR